MENTGKTGLNSKKKKKKAYCKPKDGSWQGIRISPKSGVSFLFLLGHFSAMAAHWACPWLKDGCCCSGHHFNIQPI
jgi:hypothetical protein